jgi:hypothetical protein
MTQNKTHSEISDLQDKPTDVHGVGATQYGES